MHVAGSTLTHHSQREQVGGLWVPLPTSKYGAQPSSESFLLLIDMRILGKEACFRSDLKSGNND